MITLLLAATLIMNTAGKPVIHQSIHVDEKRTIFVEGSITDASARKFISDEQSMTGDKPIYIIFNSGGGSVAAMWMYDNALDSRKDTVGIVEGSCLSACANILLHTKTRYIEPHSQIYYHSGSIGINGERFESMRQAESSTKTMFAMDLDNATRLGMPIEVYEQKIMAGGFWIEDTEACKMGITTAIVDGFVSKHKPVVDKPDDSFLDELFGP